MSPSGTPAGKRCCKYTSFYSVSTNPGTTLCGGGPVTITASSSNDPNYSYSWSLDGGTTIVGTGNTYTFSPTVNTTVYAYGVDNTAGPNGGCGHMQLLKYW